MTNVTIRIFDSPTGESKLRFSYRAKYSGQIQIAMGAIIQSGVILMVKKYSQIGVHRKFDHESYHHQETHRQPRKIDTDVLTLATASLKADYHTDFEHRRYPRVDYLELQRRLNLRTIDYKAYGEGTFAKFLHRLETKVRSDLYLALLGIVAQGRSRVVFAWSERVGIPYAQLRRLIPDSRPFVAMFQCWSPRQEFVMKNFKLHEYMDAIVVHCTSMRTHLTQIGVPAEKIHVIPYSRDHQFFKPQPNIKQRPNFILSLGETRSRDYKTLFHAVQDLPVELFVAASGHWYAREKERNAGHLVPNNVNLSGTISIEMLRTLYAQSQFVVLPVSVDPNFRF
ncbi:hypothetical protein KFU94_11750 [Chloroflexi bacterium TSY]|nr:hypothetical protein [Chloroflexi bacterium TSY]